MLHTLYLIAAILTIAGNLNNYNIKDHPLDIRVRREVAKSIRDIIQDGKTKAIFANKIDFEKLLNNGIGIEVKRVNEGIKRKIEEIYLITDTKEIYQDITDTDEVKSNNKENETIDTNHEVEMKERNLQDVRKRSNRQIEKNVYHQQTSDTKEEVTDTNIDKTEENNKEIERKINEIAKKDKGLMRFIRRHTEPPRRVERTYLTDSKRPKRDSSFYSQVSNGFYRNFPNRTLYEYNGYNHTASNISNTMSLYSGQQSNRPSYNRTNKITIVHNLQPNRSNTFINASYKPQPFYGRPVPYNPTQRPLINNQYGYSNRQYNQTQAIYMTYNANEGPHFNISNQYSNSYQQPIYRTNRPSYNRNPANNNTNNQYGGLRPSFNHSQLLNINEYTTFERAYQNNLNSQLHTAHVPLYQPTRKPLFNYSKPDNFYGTINGRFNQTYYGHAPTPFNRTYQNYIYNGNNIDKPNDFNNYENANKFNNTNNINYDHNFNYVNNSNGTNRFHNANNSNNENNLNNSNVTNNFNNTSLSENNYFTSYKFNDSHNLSDNFNGNNYNDYNNSNNFNNIVPTATVTPGSTVTEATETTGPVILGSCFMCVSMGCPAFFRRVGFLCVPEKPK